MSKTTTYQGVLGVFEGWLGEDWVHLEVIANVTEEVDVNRWKIEAESIGAPVHVVGDKDGWKVFGLDVSQSEPEGGSHGIRKGVGEE